MTSSSDSALDLGAVRSYDASDIANGAAARERPAPGTEGTCFDA